MIVRALTIRQPTLPFSADYEPGNARIHEAWNPFYELDPVWTDEFMATAIGTYSSGVLPAKEVELAAEFQGLYHFEPIGLSGFGYSRCTLLPSRRSR